MMKQENKPDTLSRLSRESDKATYESNVFIRFLGQCGLEVNRHSIRSGDPTLGEPDIICCTPAGEINGFELARLTDPNLAKVVNRWQPCNVEYVRTSDSSSAIARKKIQKTYSVDFPVQLILYKEYPIITPDDVLLPTIRPLCNLQHEYSAVWFMGDTVELLFESTSRP